MGGGGSLDLLRNFCSLNVNFPSNSFYHDKIYKNDIHFRLPIVQGCTAAFFGPIIAVMSLSEWKCPYTDDSLGLQSIASLINQSIQLPNHIIISMKKFV